MAARSTRFTSPDAIVLKWYPFGETSQIVVLATETHGQVQALAKGARRAGPSFQGGIATAMRGEAHWTERKRSELALLTSFRATTLQGGLTQDVARYRHALYVLELLRHWTRPALPAPELVRAGKTMLDLLTRAPLTHLDAWIVWFEARALAAAGHRPVLDRCAVCGTWDRELRLFQAAAGGLVHGRCQVAIDTPFGAPLRISPRQLEALHRTYGLRLRELAQEPLSPAEVLGVRLVHEQFLPHVLERRPRLMPRPGARPMRDAVRTRGE